MEAVHKPKGRLLVSNALDAKDELEEKLERCLSVISPMINGVSEREANDAMNAHVCKGAQQHEEVCLGLLTMILMEPLQAQRCYRDLTLVSRDGMNLILMKINQLLMEKYLKLQDTVRIQLVWLVREIVKNAVLGADGVCMTLMKQIAGGDVTLKNIWLSESVLEILVEQREWVLKSNMLIAMIIYTYLRLIVDHHGTPQLQSLRQKEVDFCMILLREKFMDCTMIGRDLVRLLQNVARIPEFEKLWRDILHSPQALSPQFTGVLQLLQTRTSRKFLACRLTPDMETKLLFMTSRVRFGQQKRYQDWFQRQYLSTPDSQSLRCDLIRYICGVVHPSNEVLSSDILPRWAIIGWLLTTCTSNVAASNAKLALFYDWLFFSPEKDSIMNIEPAILVMHHSMKPHPAITATLLDFICRIIPHFYPPLESHVRQGVFNSLNHIVEKRVLAPLAPLFDNPKLDKELRAMIREKFPEFCSSPSPPVEVKIEESATIDMDNHVTDKDREENCYDNTDAAFSDDEEELNNKGKKREFRFHPIKEAIVEEPVDITPYLDQLDEALKEKVLLIQKGRYGDERSHRSVSEFLVFFKDRKISVGPRDGKRGFAVWFKLLQYSLFSFLSSRSRFLPTEEMVKMVMSRPCHPDDHFTTSILRQWSMKHDDSLAEQIKALLIKNNSLPRKRQSLRSSSSKLAQLTLEQILEHLDNLRLCLLHTKQNFFAQTPILQALQHVQASCDEAHKMKFSDLFALAEDYEDSSKPSRSRRKTATSSPRSRKNASQPIGNDEDSSSSSGSEEEDAKPKPKRKRKGSSAVGSDSD
ncbi:integrator complex subunit 3 [Heptranchias perlo]|uniref:integrator complex subunit 3 n=1 Tax=Heptranchias perlo TaxID=212740 RepID=UPI00355A6103